jgi:hypothetical protein
MAHEKEMAGVRTESQKELQRRSAVRREEMVKIKSEVRAINEKYGLDIIMASSDAEKKAKLIEARDKEIDAAWAKHDATLEKSESGAAPSKADPSTGSTNTPTRVWDPITRRSVPIK